MISNFYSREELEEIGFKSIGENVLISKKTSIYSSNKISIGNNVRIDDFCILSGNITIGNNVHISAYVALYGKAGIEIKDYSGCSARSIIYSVTDDFSGQYMIGAVLPESVTNVRKEKVILEKYSQLGANTIVMPGVNIGEGAVTGALSFVNNDLTPWSINVGIPAKRIKERKKEIKELVKKIENRT